MSLDGKIMNLRVQSLFADDHSYKKGHRDARHEAAELAATAVELLREADRALDDISSACGTPKHVSELQKRMREFYL